MASKDEMTVNGHPGDDGRGPAGVPVVKRAEAPGAGGGARPESNCCLLENGKRCPRPASNASYRLPQFCKKK